MPPPPKDHPPPKSGAKAKADPPPPPPSKQDLGSPEFTTLSGSAPGSGTSTPQTISLEKYNELVTRFNHLQEAILKFVNAKTIKE